jgi:hypothetical protein
MCVLHLAESNQGSTLPPRDIHQNLRDTVKLSLIAIIRPVIISVREERKVILECIVLTIKEILHIVGNDCQ